MTVTLAALGVTDKQYTEYLENTSNFNTRLLVERRLRLPYLDSQTGVAQSDCSLWMQKRHRMPGSRHGQLYTYPAKRWRRRRLPPFLQERLMKPTEDVVDADEHQITTVENMAISKEEETTSATVDETPKETWYKDYDELSDPPDAGEIEDADSDVDDYEDYSFRRKKKKPPPRSSGSSRKKKQQAEKEKTEKDLEMEKPFACDICGARYKTRPGLTYHVTHTHQLISEHSEDSNSVPSPKVAPAPTASAQACSNARQEKVVSSDYCDFCLGDALENKKTMQPEELVSCSDCGRSGHPTCLQFTDNMLISVKKYRWQCIECKSCGLCGTSDNDDQLLFCDDCDRGYHMYCLSPPLSEPPEGSWSCHLCLEEFGEKASVNQNQDSREGENSTMAN